MKTVVNEQGQTVPYHGSEGSPLWIKTKYSRQLHEQVQSYIQQEICNVKNPIIEFNGKVEDNLDFVRAVKLYAEHPEWL